MNYYSKINTFHRSPCAPQVFSYLVSLLWIVVFYALVQSYYLSQTTRVGAIVSYSIAVIAKIISTAIVSSIDPSDELMVLSLSS